MILKIFVSGPLRNNVILLVSEKTRKAAVVDPSLDSFQKISAYIREHKLTLESIFITHSHWDHIGDIAQFKESFKANVYVHRLDSQNVKTPGYDKIPFTEKITGVQVDIFFKDGDKILLGDISIEVIHTPGHSPGSVCLYIPQENILLSGDTLFAGCMGTISLPTSQPELMWKSLKKLAKLPSDTKVYPGHGVATTIGKEAWLDDAERWFGS